MGGFEKEEEVETMWEWMSRSLKKIFVDNIPVEDVKELPPRQMFVLGFILEAGSLFLFFYFIYTGYQSSLSQEFMSLDASAGVCDPVVQPLSGTYLVDKHGHWEGTTEFRYNLAQYEFVFSNFQGTSEQYYNLLNETYEKIVDAGQAHYANNDLAYNLILWSSFSAVVSSPNGIPQKIALTGDDQYIFSRDDAFGAISNVNNDCDSSSIASYDAANYLLNLEYNYADYMLNPNCNSSIDPSFLGYDPVLDGELFKISIDMRSVTLALAINLGVTRLATLEVVEGDLHREFNASNTSIVGDQFIDPLVAGMQPIYCLGGANETMDTFDDICFIQIGNVVMLPLFNSFGYDDSRPSYCNCSNSLTVEQIGACNVFNLMPSFLFYDIPASGSTEEQVQLSLAALLDLRNQYDSYALSEKGYNASYAGASSSNPVVDPIMKESSWRHASYEFCYTNSFGYCNLLNFHLFDSDKGVSAYYYQLQNGTCTDTIIMDPGAWNVLFTSDPPAPLTEGYYKCTSYEFDAFFNAAGIASGNIGIIIPLLVVVLLPLTYLWLSTFGYVQPKPEYNDDELKRAVDIMFTQVLRSRDGKTRGMKKLKIINGLTRELVKAAMIEGGYPDSDDSDDEDDEEETGRPPSTRVTPPRAERYGRRRSSKLKESGSEQVNERRRSSALKRRQSSLVMQVTGVLPSAQMKSTNVFLKGIEGDSDDEVAGSMANVFSPFMRRGSREEGMEMGSNVRTILNKGKVADASVDLTTLSRIVRTLDSIRIFFEAAKKEENPKLSQSYLEGKALSLQLNHASDIVFNKQGSLEAFHLMREIMLLHASIQLEYTYNDAQTRYADTFGYYVGGTLVTLSSLNSQISTASGTDKSLLL